MRWGGLVGLVLVVASPLAVGSLYFKYRIVAESGQNSFIGFGNGPSINGARNVAFIAKFANG